MEQAGTMTERAHHPIRLVVTDDLQRNRLTSFFRLILAIPHIVWLALWSIVARHRDGTASVGART